jgi:hypothetical protein
MADTERNKQTVARQVPAETASGNDMFSQLS